MWSLGFAILEFGISSLVLWDWDLELDVWGLEFLSLDFEVGVLVLGFGFFVFGVCNLGVWDIEFGIWRVMFKVCI